MGLLKTIKYNCLKAQQRGIKQQYQFIGIIGWIKLKYHLTYCKVCRAFLKDAIEIDAIMIKKAEEFHNNPMYQLSEEEKNQMKKTIDDSSNV